MPAIPTPVASRCLVIRSVSQFKIQVDKRDRPRQAAAPLHPASLCPAHPETPRQMAHRPPCVTRWAAAAWTWTTQCEMERRPGRRNSGSKDRVRGQGVWPAGRSWLCSGLTECDICELHALLTSKFPSQQQSLGPPRGRTNTVVMVV